MKVILLPTDFSKNSINAIYYAMNLLENEHCEFYILNVQSASSFISDDLMTMSSSATIYQTLIGTAKKSLKNLINTIETKYKNEKHDFHSIVDYDNFVDAINQISKSKSIDLIVMGTKGATGAQKVIFGSNTVHIMQRCKTPVLAIPNGCSFTSMDKIVFTTNYSTMYNSKDMEPLMDIAKPYNSKIDVLHFSDKDSLSQDQKKIKAFLESVFSNVPHEFIDLESEDIFKTVQDYIVNNDIKMLSMMSKKHSFLERLFARHLVETFAFKIDIPFLVMHKAV
ncbi:MAG: universal stress protein [Flavobacteriaceae bacterium]|nr:universal stress protein [Flavobacteriaceae bacterium]